MSDRLLGQEEIDALLRRGLEEDGEAPEELSDALSAEEMDALGEIGNISMGAAATTLSEILNRRVSITSPVVKTVGRRQLFDDFVIPHLLIEVSYTQGLQGTTLLVMETRDAAILADLMMGGEGTNPSTELTEIEVSAAAEAMNQMIGSASTAMAALFRRTVNISPPVAKIVTTKELDSQPPLEQDQLAVIYFNIVVEDLIDNTIMQILDLDTARAEAALLWQDVESIQREPAASPGPIGEQTPPSPPPPGSAPAQPPGSEGQPAPSPVPQTPHTAAGGGGHMQEPAYASRVFTAPGVGGVEQNKLDLLLDIPLQVSVILGRSRQPVKDVLNLTPGAVVGLDVTVDEPVEILLNGVLVARGEVVVVDDNFGVRITSILNPMERLQSLRR